MDEIQVKFLENTMESQLSVCLMRLNNNTLKKKYVVVKVVV